MTTKKFVLGTMVVIAVAIAIGFMFATGPHALVSEKTPGLSSAREKTISENPVSQVRGDEPDSVILNATFPNAPPTIMVYRTIPPSITEEDALAFAKKFGITGTLKSGSEVFSLTSSDGNSIEINKKSGCQHFYANHWNDHTDEAYNLPSDDKAVETAMAFLKEKDLLPEGISLKPGEAEHHHISTSYPNGTQTQADVTVEVHFGRDDMDGIKVIDTGIEVTIGDNYEILSYDSRLRNYGPYKQLAIKTPEDAWTELQSNGFFNGIRSGGPVQSKIIINKVYLAYHSPACGYKENYLEPVYIFAGVNEESAMNMTVSMPIRAYIPALKEVPVELVSS